MKIFQTSFKILVTQNQFSVSLNFTLKVQNNTYKTKITFSK